MANNILFRAIDYGSLKIEELHQSINMGWDLESVGSWPIDNSVGCCHQQFHQMMPVSVSFYNVDKGPVKKEKQTPKIAILIIKGILNSPSQLLV